MKKLKLAALLLVLCVLLCACGKSEELKAAEDMVNAIGEVTLDSLESIEAAETAVEALSAEDAEKFDGQENLRAARDTYDALYIDSLIDAIGEVTLDSGDKIKEAAGALLNVDETVKGLVKNADALTAAQEKHNSLQADAINSRIYAIETVDASDAAEIHAIAAELETMHITVKRLVDTEAFAEKQAEFETIAAERKATLESYFNFDYDSFKKAGFYHHGGEPKYADDRCYILPYIGTDGDGDYWMCWRVNYTGEDWVFYENVIIQVDGVNYTQTYSYYDVVRESSWGDVYEQLNEVIDEQEIELLRKMANSTEVYVRFQGDEHVHDFTVPAKDKAMIKEILEYWDLVNG